MSQLKTNVPALRFPEFKSIEEWRGSFLGTHSDITTGKLDANAMITNGKYRFYTCAKDYYRIDSYAFDTEALLISGNGANVGYIHHYKGKFNAYQRTYVLDQFNENIIFIKYFLERHLKSRIDTEKKEGNTPYIVMSTLTEMKILIPLEKEQQKIANCLSSLDELISAKIQKVEVLKAHKKGLMQQLFPSDGETVPKLRFPEFMNAGEWKKNQLEEIVTFLKGKGIPKADIVTCGKQPCIRYGELYTLYSETIENISSYTNLSGNSLVLSKENDVIIPSSGETQEDIATASCVINDGIALGGDLNILRGETNGVFLSYYLNSAKKKAISQLAQGIVVVPLYSSQLKKLSVNTPKPKEQQKIADCLSSLDELITIHIQKIELLKAHKKGLMQQLFPSIDEVNK